MLAFATAQERAILTINRKHFIAFHRTSPNHAVIIVCTLDADLWAKRSELMMRSKKLRM